MTEALAADPVAETTPGHQWLLHPTALLWMFAAAGTAFLALTFRPTIEGDGVGYYSYLHAIFVSHSLSFSSEYGAAIAAKVPLYHDLLSHHTGSGQLANFFPVGSAVLATPTYLAALGLHPSGEPQYGSPFVEAFSIASLLYGLVALGVCYRFASAAIGDRGAAVAGVAGGLFATPLYYYAFSEPSYSHAFSLFCVSAFVYLWWKGPPTTNWGWLGLGVLGGVMGMTRFQDGLLLGLVLLDLRRLRWAALLIIPGAILGFAPQLAVDQIQFGHWWPARPPGQDLNPLQGHYIQVLVASRHGLFVWAPGTALAALGVLMLRDRRLQLACVVGFVLELAVIGAAPDSEGASFGPRRFIELTPFVILGLGVVVRRAGRAGWLAVAILSAWNLVLVANFEYLLSTLPDPGYWRVTIGQAKAAAYVPRLFTKGVVVRNLLLSSQAHVRFDPIGGLAMLAAEAACLVAAVFAAVGWRALLPGRLDARPNGG